MKAYSRKIRQLQEQEAKLVEQEKVMFLDDDACKLIRKSQGQRGEWDAFAKPLISSEEFLNKYKTFIDEIAAFKIDLNKKVDVVQKDGSVKKTYKKNSRSMEYASVGVMDRHDVQQEAYLAFLESYNNVKWDRIKAASNPDAMLWAYLKQSTVKNLNIAIRQQKDGIRLPEWYIKEHNVYEGITSLFATLDKRLGSVEDQANISPVEAELVRNFMNDVMGKYLDVKANGDRNDKGIERELIKHYFKIYDWSMTTKELADFYDVNINTLEKNRSRALKKLKSEDCMREIKDFLNAYKIKTGTLADIDARKTIILENNDGLLSGNEDLRPCITMKGITKEISRDNINEAIYYIDEFVKWTRSENYEDYRFNKYFDTLDSDWLIIPTRYKKVIDGELVSVVDMSQDVISTDEANKRKNQILSKELGLIKRYSNDVTKTENGKEVTYRTWTSEWGKTYRYKGENGQHPKGDDFLRNLKTMKDVSKSEMTVKLGTHTQEYPLNTELAEGEILHESKVKVSANIVRDQYGGGSIGVIGNNIPIGI